MIFGDINGGGYGYFGHAVTGVCLNIAPILAQADGETIEGRLMFSLCGGAGAALMLIGDRPSSWADTVSRIVSGIAACFLFAPYIIAKFGIKAETNSIMAVFGIIGACSWYIAGSVSHGLRALRDSGSIWRMILAFLRWSIPPEKTPDKPTAADPPKPIDPKP